MAHDIIDNSEIKLTKVLKEKLSISKKAKFAVGWLFITGFKELRNEIDKLEKLEIIAGSRTNRQTAELMQLSKKWTKAVQDTLENKKYLPESKKKEILDIEFKELINDLSYIKPTEENIEFLRWFSEKLKNKTIEIRIYYKEPLHAKLYIFEYKNTSYGKGESIVGSSNFSLSGFNLNTELNVRILGNDNYKTLSEWFKKRWKESENAEFTILAQKAIDKSWAFNQEVTPFRVYLKVLHEIFKYEEEKPKIDIEAELYQFQKDAVIAAYNKLKEFNGVFISDVPGLGKTYIASALLSHLETEGKTAVVIAPPRLTDYWEDVLADFGAAKAKVFSSGKLDKILNNEKYLKKKLVLVDECHHFRNPDTNKYRDLSKICQNKEVILLSATPQNLNIWDIYWQLKLFTPYEANHNLRISPIELKQFFKACENNNANVEDLISQIFIRRTRSDIKDYYPDKKINFPERKGPYRLDYSIDEVYKGGLYLRLQELLNKLNYARYNLGQYAKKEMFDSDELQRLTVAWGNLQRLVKINFYRRLESSVQAFKDSVKNNLERYKAFRLVLDKREKIIVGDIDELIGLREDELEDVEFKEEDYIDAEKFKIKKLKKELEEDISVLKDIDKSVGPIKPEDDDKFNRLIKELSSEAIRNKKIIIFSSFASTVKYLFDNLKKEKFKKVDYIVGGKQILTKIKRFAPKANNAKVSPEDEIQIMISTEVLSEGLNLQDGQVVINYDLHWNPVRIIQRIGRIDRISSKHDNIYLYNFFPETKAEKEIKIESKVTKRVEEIINNFGYDTKTINIDEPEVRKKLFEIYTENSEAIEEKQERSDSKYFELQFRKLSDQYLEEYKKSLELPALINVARNYKKDKGLIVFCRADDYYRLKLADLKGRIINSDDWKILKILECSVNEEFIKFNREYFKIIEIVKDNFEHEANKRESDKRSTTDPVKNEFGKLIKWFKRKESKKTKQEFDVLFDFVNSKQLNHHQSKFIRKLSRSYKKKFGLKKKEVLEELKKEIHPKLKTALPDQQPEVKPKYAQVIIAEELR